MAEENFKTSFIPTKPIQTVDKGGTFNKKGGGNFLTVIATIIFFATLIIAGGVFSYKLALEKKYQGQIDQLERARQSLDSALITEATRLNNRIESVKSLTANHTAPTQIFRLLEEATLSTVKFDSLIYRDEAGTARITGRGQAADFQSVVSQSDRFGQTGYLRDVLFSSLQPNQQTGGVSFNIEATVDRQSILYRNSLSSAGPESVESSQDTGTSFEFPESSVSEDN